MRCGKPLEDETMQYCYSCKNNQHLYEQGKAAFVYNRSMKSSIAAFKYGARKEYGRYYAAELAKKHESWIKKTGAQALIPVPIHKERHKKRGYNQAKVIADYLEGETGIPVIDDYLIRIKNTEALKELSVAERKASLEDAFLVSETSKLLYRNLRCVILVDDIYTTGSTINECAATLKKSGVLKVYFLCACIGKDQGGE
jgi:ComF family protein